MDLVKLQNEIHAQNKTVGWWDNPREFSTFACLFHSELSEAMEGDRKNLMDDHLPAHKMFWVELADFAIRAMDWLGHRSHGRYEYAAFTDLLSSKVRFLEYMHEQVSLCSGYMRMEYHRTRSTGDHCIANCVTESIAYATHNGVDLLQIIAEKVEYNLHRADHKRENREKSDGKKY